MEVAGVLVEEGLAFSLLRSIFSKPGLKETDLPMKDPVSEPKMNQQLFCVHGF